MRAVCMLGLLAGCFAAFDPKPAGDDASPPPPPLVDAASDADPSLGEIADMLLKEWSGCLTKANFDAANMTAWATVTTLSGACQNCHDGGAFGFLATTNGQLFFDTITTMKFYMLEYFSVDFSNGAEAAKVVVNETNFAAVSSTQPPHQKHPSFPVENAGMTALRELFNSTEAVRVAGQCGPPRF